MERIYRIFRVPSPWSFDPVRDLLGDNCVFTWRRLGQLGPAGGTVVGVATRSERQWTIGPRSSFEHFRVGNLVERWLDSQLISPDSLGPWTPSRHRGLLRLAAKSWITVEAGLTQYNSLIKELFEDDDLALEQPKMLSSGTTQVSFTAEGQVAAWNFNSHSQPLDFWIDARPELLKCIKQIQRAKFDPSSVIPVTIENG